MGLEQDMAGREAYIARANKRIKRQRRVADRSRNPHIADTARDLVCVLTVLLRNVERKHRFLRKAGSTH